MEVFRDTSGVASEELTPSEEKSFNRLMNTPEMRALVNPSYYQEHSYQDERGQTEIITNQLEMALQKKRTEVDQNEQMIKGVSLHDSILDKDLIQMVENESKNDQNDMEGANNKLFDYVKGYDIHNEKRPSY